MILRKGYTIKARVKPKQVEVQELPVKVWLTKTFCYICTLWNEHGLLGW